MTTLPKEIINEIGQLVQPKYKCIRIKYFAIDMGYSYNGSGFTIREGDKIFIIDDSDKGKYNQNNLKKLILDERQCIIYTKSQVLRLGCGKDGDFNIDLLLSLKVGESIKMETYEDEEHDLYENYIKVTLVEKF